MRSLRIQFLNGMEQLDAIALSSLTPAAPKSPKPRVLRQENAGFWGRSFPGFPSRKIQKGVPPDQVMLSRFPVYMQAKLTRYITVRQGVFTHGA
jgi:hypothetical protein